MLSPDSFYYFFREHYGYPSTDSVIFYPRYHGAKLIHEYIPYLHGEFKEQYRCLDDESKSHFGSIVLHDQEALTNLWYFASTYLKKQFPDKTLTEKDIAEFIYTKFVTSKKPIWCHSEKNSDEIDMLKNAGWIECYYWYHGLISLNWFNEWRWCADFDNIYKNSDAKRFMIYAREFSGTREYRKTLLDYLREIKSQIHYDWENLKNIDGTYSAKIDHNDAIKSYVHIVAETIFDTKKQHLTEKSLKPIVMAQPFIIASGPGSLEYLRSYGFQTFSSVWDESYDCESDSRLRLDMIVELIKKLCSLSDREFQKIYKKTIDIVEHNRRWFYSEKFYNILINELESNMKKALNERHQEIRLDN